MKTEASIILVSLLTFGLSSCSGSRLASDRTYESIKPKQQLPERELTEIPENLVVKIENVADAGGSYSNFVRLYVNGREVAPVEEVSNFTSTYSYPMRLQHGVYDVKAEYHVVGYWQEQVFEILPDEPVKVMPNHRTVLTAKLAKTGGGIPIHNPTRFRLRYEKLSENMAIKPVETVETKVVAQPEPRPAPKEQKVLKPQEQGHHETAKEPKKEHQKPTRSVQEPRENFVLLQINTSPTGANVIVDDRFCGQTPIRVSVIANQNHVIQLARPGYQEIVRIVDVNDLQGQSLVQLVFKLEAASQK